MQPTLWGPATWDVMFACAWTCKKADFKLLSHTIFTLLPSLLPCSTCRDHFRANVRLVHKRNGGAPTTPYGMVRWLWHCKDAVNKSLHQPSAPFTVVTDRLEFHGGVVDDVRVGDVLVFFAMSAKENRKNSAFIELCRAIATLLPGPEDSELRRTLRAVREPIVTSAVFAAQAARIERGYPRMTLKHYQRMSR